MIISSIKETRTMWESLQKGKYGKCKINSDVVIQLLFHKKINMSSTFSLNEQMKALLITSGLQLYYSTGLPLQANIAWCVLFSPRENVLFPDEQKCYNTPLNSYDIPIILLLLPCGTIQQFIAKSMYFTVT